jgi:hypothetical protein
MSLLPTITSTYAKTSATVSIAEAFTESVTRYTIPMTATYTYVNSWDSTVAETSAVSADTPYATDKAEIAEFVAIHVSMDVPLNCENIRYYWGRYERDQQSHYDGNQPWDGDNIVYD